ncbi:hypothetical protein CNMCM7691_009066 [Aspergillus felis]|uniref:Zn(2)-C6 fungal-type domain-containing protein n=1 Tax=Aspergillus felis TaxID=1287682 RepID=A0A8H6V5W7_9EURO|nr:hypothetical protein CNMCM7691_009066 [Aspergillus felis]
MPFCCRPSKFCLGCRQRRIKCDMAIPACSQCTRAGKECVGYRDELPLLFRDENARTIRRATAAKVRSRAQRKDAGSDAASSPDLQLMGSGHGTITATSLPSTLPCLDMDNLGLQFFIYHFSTYAWAGRCPPQPIASPFMHRISENETLRSAVASVGLAALSNIRKDEAILRGARQRYGQAIRVIQNTLRSKKAYLLEGTMKMILMVALFEIVDASPTSKLSWIVHLQGAAALRNRSPRDFFRKNHRSHIMFTFTWIFKYFQTGGRFPLELESWSAPDIPVEADDDFPAISLIEILLKFIRLKACLADRNDQPLGNALTEALACEMRLEAWSTSLPAKFGYMEKVSTDTSQYFHGRFHLYEDVWASRILIHYLVGRLLVNELILRLAPLYATPMEQILRTAQASRTIIQMAVDICVAAASQPLFLDYMSLNRRDYMSLNRNDAMPPLSGVFMLMYPLAVAATATGVSDDLHEWVLHTLDHIGQTMGIRQALLMKAEINNFLDNIQAHPITFGAAPDGSYYRDASLRPRQHVQRPLHPNWTSQYIAKLQLNKSPFKNVEFWSMADMLGLLLGLLGPAQFLSATHSKVRQMVPATLFGMPPRVFQCTWDAAGDGRYSLGASMSGYNAEKTRTGSWLAVLNRARFSVISTERFRLSGWSQAWSPSIRRRGKLKGIPFGRCAETYPLRLMLRDAAEKSAIHGLALSARGLRATDTYDDHFSSPIWRNTWHPCSNCKALIETMGGSVANFNKYNGWQGDPGYHFPN